MKEKRKDCLYCGKEMKDVKTVRKKFCSDLCRVNFNNEVKYEKEIREILNKPIFNKLKKDVLFNMIVYGQSEKPIESKIEIKPIAKESYDAKIVGNTFISSEQELPRIKGESSLDYKVRYSEWVNNGRK